MRIALALACALVLAGCGTDPTTGTSFSPPPGWKQLPSMFGFKMWLNPVKGSNSVVMLFKLPNKANVDVQKDIDFSSNPYYHGGSITKKSAITICGNHPAEYLLSQDTGTSGKSGEAEIVLTKWGQDTYMALYARSNGDKPNSAAEAAIRTICVK
jgi:hypothetical protein